MSESKDIFNYNDKSNIDEIKFDEVNEVKEVNEVDEVEEVKEVDEVDEVDEDSLTIVLESDPFFLT